MLEFTLQRVGDCTRLVCALKRERRQGGRRDRSDLCEAPSGPFRQTGPLAKIKDEQESTELTETISLLALFSPVFPEPHRS